MLSVVRTDDGLLVALEESLTPLLLGAAHGSHLVGERLSRDRRHLAGFENGLIFGIKEK